LAATNALNGKIYGTMQALNHVAFGTLVALVVKEPLLAVPLALGSHFVMDALPHYGEDHKAPRFSRRYYGKILVDAQISILFGAWVLAAHPPHAWLVAVCGLVAVSPDFLWPIALYIKHQGPLWEFFEFHKRIQHESRAGIFVEIAWFAATGAAVFSLVH
jgi:hypothetical protein